MAQPARADTRQLVARLLLIPHSPGAQISAPDVYPAEAVPPARFDVFLDQELNGQSLEQYLADRQQLLACHYAVWLYRFDNAGALGKQSLVQPTLVIEADGAGQFPLAGPAVTPGRLYAWQAVVTVAGSQGGSVQVWSAPLYFRTTPAEEYFPAVLEPAARDGLIELARLASEQERAAAALQASLRGLLPFSNCPSSSELYLSIPVTGDDTCPRPDTGGKWQLTQWQLTQLGRCAARLSQGRDELPPTPPDLGAVGAELYSCMQQWAEEASSVPPKEFAVLVDIADRMRGTSASLDQQQAAALYGEFTLGADALVGSGSIELRSGYEQAFLAYAAASQARLAAARRLKPELESLLGAQEASLWLGAFTGASQLLSGIAGEVERGRLGKTQLTARLGQLNVATPPAVPGELRYLESTAGRVNLESVKHLTPSDAPQLAQLGAELARCHLQRLAGAIWPTSP